MTMGLAQIDTVTQGVYHDTKEFLTSYQFALSHPVAVCYKGALREAHQGQNQQEDDTHINT